MASRNKKLWKIAAIAIIVSLGSTVVYGVVSVVLVRREIQRLDSALGSVKLGDTAEEVERLMGLPNRVIRGGGYRAERGVTDAFEESPGEKCTHQYVYFARTPPLFGELAALRAWVVGFNDNKVVHKFHLD